VSLKGVNRDNKIYAVIAILIVIVVILAVFFSTNELNEAIIEDYILGDTWNENIAERESDSQFWGLEKWISYTYKNFDSNFPAYVTVTTINTLFMMSEEALIDQTLNTIQKAEGIVIDENSKITGERLLNNGHKTIYFIYDGNDTSKKPYQKIKIIGETWNCGTSGTSVICIGLAQVTNNFEINTIHWAKIIRDKNGTFGLGDFKGIDGLIFNVKCH
jgi:hypothetical protein